MTPRSTAQPGGRAALTMAVVLILALAAYFVFKPKAPEVVPSFSDPIGPLDTSKIPNGWAPDVNAAAKVAGIPAPVLAAQLETESHWNPKAESPAGAQGVAQFTPAAWEQFGEGGDPFDPKTAIAAQGRLLAHLKKRVAASKIPGNPTQLTLAAYNAGFGNVTKYNGVPPFEETQNYVKKIALRMGHFATPLASQAKSSSAVGETPGRRSATDA